MRSFTKGLRAVPLLSLLAAALPANSTVPSNAIYKNPKASVDDRITDLLSRMTLEEKVGQVMQGDISNWLNVTDGSFNRSGLVDSMSYKTGQFYVGYPVEWEWIARETLRAQKYLVEETRLGIPALVQTEGKDRNTGLWYQMTLTIVEGIHGFLVGNATIFNSPIAYGCAFDPKVRIY